MEERAKKSLKRDGNFSIKSFHAEIIKNCNSAAKRVENLNFTISLTLKLTPYLVYPTIFSIIRPISIQNCIQQQHDTRCSRFISKDFNANLLFDSRRNINGNFAYFSFNNQQFKSSEILSSKKTFKITPSTTRIFHFHNRLINAKGISWFPYFFAVILAWSGSRWKISLWLLFY